jgi:hypothetical protein
MQAIIREHEITNQFLSKNNSSDLTMTHDPRKGAGYLHGIVYPGRKRLLPTESEQVRQ